MIEHHEHRLEGLESDNFLAFMALLGLLRALETAKPEWRPRAHWDVEVQPLRPVLSLRAKGAKVAQEEIAETAAAGIEALARYHKFEGRNAIDFLVDEAVAELSADDCNWRAVMECLLTPAAYKKDAAPQPTPYCLMFGQGHQHFLARFSSVPRMGNITRGSGAKATVVSPAQSVAEALFARWRREDATESFRWDPAEANRYALRAINPSGDAAATNTQHGANRLAAIALPLLPTCAVDRRGEARTLAVGASFASGRVEFRWPIWSEATSLAGIVALMKCCAPRHWTANGPLAPGIQTVMVARRVSIGKLMNIASAMSITRK